MPQTQDAALGVSVSGSLPSLCHQHSTLFCGSFVTPCQEAAKELFWVWLCLDQSWLTVGTNVFCHSCACELAILTKQTLFNPCISKYSSFESNRAQINQKHSFFSIQLSFAVTTHSACLLWVGSSEISVGWRTGSPSSSVPSSNLFCIVRVSKLQSMRYCSLHVTSMCFSTYLALKHTKVLLIQSKCPRFDWKKRTVLLAAGVAQCYWFRMRIMLITQRCFGYCEAVLHRAVSLPTRSMFCQFSPAFHLGRVSKCLCGAQLFTRLRHHSK